MAVITYQIWNHIVLILLEFKLMNPFRYESQNSHNRELLSE